VRWDTEEGNPVFSSVFRDWVSLVTMGEVVETGQDDS